MFDLNSQPAQRDASDDVPTLVAHVFRRWYARITSALVRAMGATEIDAVEDAVQEALLAALQHWPYRGIPAQPEAWLYQVARRKLLDQLARRSIAQRGNAQLANEQSGITRQTDTDFARSTNATSDREIPPHWRTDNAHDSLLDDDELTMMFLAAHPSLTPEAQITLMLRTVCGLSTAEIAAALLQPESTIAQRIVRAKRTLSSASEPFEIPGTTELSARLDVVLHALYLMFSEG